MGFVRQEMRTRRSTRRRACVRNDCAPVVKPRGQLVFPSLWGTTPFKYLEVRLHCECALGSPVVISRKSAASARILSCRDENARILVFIRRSSPSFIPIARQRRQLGFENVLLFVLTVLRRPCRAPLRAVLEMLRLPAQARIKRENRTEVTQSLPPAGGEHGS